MRWRRRGGPGWATPAPCERGWRPTRTTTTSTACLLHYEKGVALRVAQPEHRRNGVAHPVDRLVDVDAGGLQLRVVAVDVVGLQADAGLPLAGRRTLRRWSKGDGRVLVGQAD